eukprot:COSAG02_NODE_419_length_22613_cov_22.994492_20_plen_102_part_00
MYSIAAKANEVAAAGSGISSFTPKRGYKLVDSRAKGEDGQPIDVADEGSTDDFTQMEVGKAGKHRSELPQAYNSHTLSLQLLLSSLEIHGKHSSNLHVPSY